MEAEHAADPIATAARQIHVGDAVQEPRPRPATGAQSADFVGQASNP